MSTSFQNKPVAVDSTMPAQSALTNGKTLISNGVTVSWNTILGLIGTNAGQTPQAATANAVLPPQGSNAGKFLTSDGSNVSWASSAGSTTIGDIGTYVCILGAFASPGTVISTGHPGTWVMVSVSGASNGVPGQDYILCLRTA
jgi:hypothetical protein